MVTSQKSRNTEAHRRQLASTAFRRKKTATTGKPYLMPCARRNQYRGSVSSEYLVVMVLVAGVLFSGHPSALTQLLDSIYRRYQLFAWLVALP